MCCCMMNCCVIVILSRIMLLFASFWAIYRIKNEYMSNCFACTIVPMIILALYLTMRFLCNAGQHGKSKCSKKNQCTASMNSPVCGQSKCSVKSKSDCASRFGKKKCSQKRGKRTICCMAFVLGTFHYFYVLYALPCLVTDFLVGRCFPWQYASLPLMITIFPTAIYIIDDVTNCLLMDSIIIGNVILLTVLGWCNGCPVLILTGWVFLLVHFVSRMQCCKDLTKEAIYNIGMIIFLGCCLLSLGIEIYGDSGSSCGGYGNGFFQSTSFNLKC